MAGLRYTGIYRPVGLQWLVSEGILPEDAPPTSYRCDVYDDPSAGVAPKEELIITNYCVVYSKGTAVCKAFRFELEKQKINHAVLTWFSSEHDTPAESVESRNNDDRSSAKEASADSRAVKKPGLTQSLSFRQKPGYGEQVDIVRHPSQVSTRTANSKSRTRAVVIFLKSQAHVYFVGGSSYMINIPFEVERVFATPEGVLIQKFCAAPQATSALGPPPAGYMSSFVSSTGSNNVNRPAATKAKASKATWRASQSSRTSFALDDLLRNAEPARLEDLPRHYSLSDPFGEMGLVGVHVPTAPSAHRRADMSSRGLHELSAEEEILYATRSDELPQNKSSPRLPLILILTANHSSKVYTLYDVRYTRSEMLVTEMQRWRTVNLHGSNSRRRSSFVPGTEAATPAIRPRDQARESFIGPSGSHVDHIEPLTAEETFVSRLDPDFERLQQPAKESRRVSSLLARGDLSTGHERSTFQELASVNNGGVSYTRRAPSLGPIRKRPSSSMKRGSYVGVSTPGSTVSKDQVSHSSEEDLEHYSRQNTPGTSADPESSIDGTDIITKDDIGSSFSKLQTELVLEKLVELPIDKPGGFSAWTKTEYLRNPRIFTVCEPETIKNMRQGSRGLTLHIVQNSVREHIEIVLDVRSQKKSTSASSGSRLQPQFSRVFRHMAAADSAQLDAMKFSDAGAVRVLSLNNTHDSTQTLTVRPCWSLETPSALISLPLQPEHLSSHRAYTATKQQGHEAPSFIRLADTTDPASFALTQEGGSSAKLHIRLNPEDTYVRATLRLCSLVLPAVMSETIALCWWQLWNRTGTNEVEAEWTALLTTILSLAVGRIAPPTAARKRSKSPIMNRLPDGSMSQSDGTDHNFLGSIQNWQSEQSAVWHSADRLIKHQDPRATLHGRSHSDLVLRCITKAREFVASTYGSALLSPFYDRGESGRHDLARLLLALHLFREEQKLDSLKSNCLGGRSRDIGPVLAQLGQWLGWSGWTPRAGGYYDLEDCGATRYSFESSTIPGYPSFSPPIAGHPPQIFDWISLNLNSARAASTDFLTLNQLCMGLNDTSIVSTTPQALIDLIESLTPRTIMLTNIFQRLKAKSAHVSSIIDLMTECKVDMSMIDTFPESVAAQIHDAIVQCQSSPLSSWHHDQLRLVGREDMIKFSEKGDFAPRLTSQPISLIQTHHDVRTVCQEVGRPTMPTSPPVLERHRVAQLIYHEDRRYWEAEKLLNTLRPSVATCVLDPNWSDTEVLEAQKGVVQCVMVRTFSLAVGQSMYHYDSRRPFLNEKFHIHGYNMSCVMKPSNITLSAEKVQFTEEKYGWAWFHAGAAAGLSISKHARGIDTSWIVFNKPAELSNRHAGLLLGLGLNGHLRSIAKWLAFKYLTPKHTMTSTGLLLGLSASFIGSMDTLVTRLLSVHITRMLPVGAAELNLSPLTQTTGLMGIGILYYGTQHRRMSEIMLSELEYVGQADTSETAGSVYDENYRLAAGFALGYINLGKGADLRGLHDMRILERLLAVAVGSRQVNLVHVLDQATAGAVIAIGLIYMKTGNRSIARKIDVPDTVPQFDYVRPDVLLLRTLAKHIIMWDEIEASPAWLRRSLPTAYSSPTLLQNLKVLNSEHLPFYNILAGLLWCIALKYVGTASIETRDFLIQYLDHFIRIAQLPAHRYDAKLTRNTVCNCQDLVALSCAIVMAGTGDIVVFRRLRRLHGRTSPDVTYGSHMAAHMALGFLFLGGGCYTLNSSNLAVASLILSLYPLYPTSVIDNSSHLQAFRHFWALAAEARCLIVRDFDTKRAITLPFSITTTDGSVSKTLRAPMLLPPLSTIAQLSILDPEYWPLTLDFSANPAHLRAFKADQTVFVRRRPPSSLHDASAFHTTLMALDDAQGERRGRAAWEWIFRLPIFDGFEPAVRGLADAAPALQRTRLLADGGGGGGGTSSSGASLAGGSDAPFHAAAVATTTTPPSLERPGMKAKAMDSRLWLRRVAWEGVAADELRDLKALFAWADGVAARRGRVAWLGEAVVQQLKAVVERRGRRIAAGSVG